MNGESKSITAQKGTLLYFIDCRNLAVVVRRELTSLFPSRYYIHYSICIFNDTFSIVAGDIRGACSLPEDNIILSDSYNGLIVPSQGISFGVGGLIFEQYNNYGFNKGESSL